MWCYVNIRYLWHWPHLCTLSFNIVKCIKFLLFYVCYCDPKEKYHIRRNIDCKKNKFICEESIIVIFICQKSGSFGPIQQKSKSPLPYLMVYLLFPCYKYFKICNVKMCKIHKESNWWYPGLLIIFYHKIWSLLSCI